MRIDVEPMSIDITPMSIDIGPLSPSLDGAGHQRLTPGQAATPGLRRHTRKYDRGSRHFGPVAQESSNLEGGHQNAVPDARRGCALLSPRLTRRRSRPCLEPGVSRG